MAANPIILELNHFANLCGYFHNAYLTDGISYNNGYNCRHPRQEEVTEEDGKIIGGCFCHSCPLGYPPDANDLAKNGVLSEKEAAEYHDGESDLDYIVVSDDETVAKLRSCGITGLIP